MAEDDIEQYLDYFDEHRIQFQFVEMPDVTPDAVWYAEIRDCDDTPRPPRDRLVREIEEALTTGQPVPHAVDVKRSYLDWGASAAAQEILVQVANFVLEQGKEAAGDLIKVGAGGGLALLWEKWRKRGSARRSEPSFSRGAAEAKARDVLAHTYGLSEETLSSVGESQELREGRWSFRFRDDSASYVVILEDHGVELLTVEIKREIQKH
jgi:hypothetical protein